MNAMKTRGSYEKRDETTIDRIRSTDRFALNDRELSMGKGRLDSQYILYMYSCCRFSVRGRNPASSREPVKRIIAATYCGRINWENWEEHRCDLGCLGLKCLSLAFHWTWPYNPKQGTQYTSIYTGETERYIYANILHNVQAICKANSISFFALSQSTPNPLPPQSQVMCKRKVKCKADDGQTDWQIDKSSQLTETCPAPPRNDLTPNQFVVWLASLWQSDEVPQWNPSTPPPLPLSM